jgi:hypothetical protein
MSILALADACGFVDPVRRIDLADFIHRLESNYINREQ